ncbi:MAG: DUF1553 domain-containing protein, partial [Planctomycetaceae bacterium]|nr:DUF1553 domain-containing protein [Planctomycetaceae bacterium]
IDRVNTTGLVWLGTSLECCQCHDHKYDPFTRKDYYQIFAYFNNTPLEVQQDSGVQFDFVGPSMPLPLSPELAIQRDKLQSELAALETQLANIREKQLNHFEEWKKRVQKAIAEHPVEWKVHPIRDFSSTGGEDFEILEDGSVLIGGSVPSTTFYKIKIEGPLEDVIGFKLETLTHDSLPGKGPGRGDAERTNFILSEFNAHIIKVNGKSQNVELTLPKADFSQANWDVSQAIDGDRKTGWAISPQFHKPHWATFRTEAPLQLAANESLELSLDQNFGRGRTIGRLRVSLLRGDELAADLPQDVIALLKKSKLNKKEQSRLESYYAESNPEIGKLETQLKKVKQQLERVQPDETLVMVEMPKPRETHMFNRGNYLDPGAKVEPGTPASMHPLNSKFPQNRLGLARWLVDPANPLLARVTVNRWWAELFGQGIVSTEEDFGTQAEFPTHPQLLDWLAVEFM